MAWSPVIMRTRMPASLQSAIASLASLRGGSTIPTSASSVRPCTSSSRSPPGRSSRGRCRARPRPAPAGPRRRAGRSRPGRDRGRPPRARLEPSASRICDERASSTSGAPLTKQRTTLRPPSSISWNVAMSLYSESNGTSATRGKTAPRLVDVEPALRGEHDERRLGRVADDLAVAHRRVVGERHRQQERLERTCPSRRRRGGSCPRWSSPRPRSSSGGRRRRARARSSG